MKNSNFKLIRNITKTQIEIFANKNLERNTSYEIQNCIRDTIKPKELIYKFDYWFDDNDSGYFLKENIKVEIHYGVMTDFTFYIDKKHTESEIQKVENWIELIFQCLREKEKKRLDSCQKEVIEKKTEIQEKEIATEEIDYEGLSTEFEKIKQKNKWDWFLNLFKF